jgi:hypothetical protein
VITSCTMRRALFAVVFLVAAACKADDECSGFGCPDDGAGTADDAPSTATAPMSTDSANDDDDDDGSSGSASASMSGDDDDSASTTAPDDTTADEDASSSGAIDESTTAPPCEGNDCPVLGECFGIGIWESCDQFCEANDAVCVEGGCGGATVVLYGDAMACIDMRSNGDADQPCDAGFDQQGGGVSFGRCCCDG